jgi:hypothetical protein
MGGPPGLTAVLKMARPQGERPAAVCYPFGHPTPYAMVSLLPEAGMPRYELSVSDSKDY